MVTTGEKFAPLTYGSCDAGKEWVTDGAMHGWVAWFGSGVNMYVGACSTRGLRSTRVSMGAIADKPFYTSGGY